MTILNYKDINPNADKAVLLIHGLGANADSWDYQLDSLTQAGYRIIIPEMRGFGKTPYNNEDMNVELMAKDCYELLQGLDIQKPDIVGLSMGGAIAQRYALNYPNNLDKLVLANTAAKFCSTAQRAIFYIPRFIAFKFFSVENWSKAVSKMVFPKEEHQKYRDEYVKELLESDPEGYIKTFRSLLKMNMESETYNIKAPTLIIGGKSDHTTPLRKQKFLAKKIAGAKFVIFDGGHVTPIECSEDFNREMLAFLSESN